MVSNDKTIAANRRALGWLASGILSLICACAQNGDSSSAGTGGLGLQLKVGTEVSVREITYQLRQTDGPFARSGSFGVDASGDMATAFIGSLAPADGYQMQLDAQAVLQSSGASTHCSGLASFGIEKGETTVVAVRMRCEGVKSSPASPGNQCPSIASLRALPAEAPVGRSVALQVDASDPDGKAVVLTYMWSASIGRIATPFTAATSYQCSQPGIVELTVAVSDGDPLCAEQATLYVSCRAVGDPSGAAGNPLVGGVLGSAGRAAANGTAAAFGGAGALAAGRSAAVSGAGAGGAGRVAASGSAGWVSNIWPPPLEPQQGSATPPVRTGGGGVVATNPPRAGNIGVQTPAAAGGSGGASSSALDAGAPMMDPPREPERRRGNDGSGERSRRREGEGGDWAAQQAGTGGNDPPSSPETTGNGGAVGIPGPEVPPAIPTPGGTPPVAGGAPTQPVEPPTSGSGAPSPPAEPPPAPAAGSGAPWPPPEPAGSPAPAAGSGAPWPPAEPPSERAGSSAPAADSGVPEPPTQSPAGNDVPAAGSGEPVGGSGGAPRASLVRNSSQHAA